MVLSQCAPAASIPLRTCPKRQNRLGVVSLNIYRALQSGSNGTARSGLRRKRHSRILVSTISGPGLPKPCVMLPIDGGASPSFSRHPATEARPTIATPSFWHMVRLSPHGSKASSMTCRLYLKASRRWRRAIARCDLGRPIGGLSFRISTKIVRSLCLLYPFGLRGWLVLAQDRHTVV